MRFGGSAQATRTTLVRLSTPRHTVVQMSAGEVGRSAPGFDPAAALARLASGRRAERLVHVHEVPARPARTVEWPEWVSPPVYAAFSGAGIPALPVRNFPLGTTPALPSALL